MTAPPLRYRIAIQLLTPLLVVWVVGIAWRQAKPLGDAQRFLRERLGFYSKDTSETGVASADESEVVGVSDADTLGQRHRWIHAASVGEVLTALPLIHATRHQNLLVTTATATGAAVLRQRAPDVRHRYLPIDRQGAVTRFLNAEQPISAWVVETEIWPWLYAVARQRALPISIVNARLSERTMNGARRGLLPVYAHALNGVKVLARSAADRDRYRTLGSSNARVIGDLKHAVPEIAQSATLRQEGSTARLDLPYYLAASTHEDEEEQLTKAWLAKGHSALLVIAPRHPERGTKLAITLSALAGHTVAQRGKQEWPQAGDHVYLADTLGELDTWFAHAQAVFVGGSLIPRGGHNLMEPARAARAIVTGRHTDNFRESVAELSAADALYMADSAEDVVDWLMDLNEDQRRERGARAYAVAMADADVLTRYLDALGVDC